jgi:hypothetical protein
MSRIVDAAWDRVKNINRVEMSIHIQETAIWRQAVQACFSVGESSDNVSDVIDAKWLNKVRALDVDSSSASVNVEETVGPCGTLKPDYQACRKPTGEDAW